MTQVLLPIGSETDLQALIAQGDIAFDHTNAVVRVGDGQTPGGIVLGSAQAVAGEAARALAPTVAAVQGAAAAARPAIDALPAIEAAPGHAAAAEAAAVRAAGLTSDAIAQGSVPLRDSRAAFAASALATGQTSMRLAGYDAPGDGGDAGAVLVPTSQDFKTRYPKTVVLDKNGNPYNRHSRPYVIAIDTGLKADGHQTGDTTWDGTDNAAAFEEVCRLASDTGAEVILPAGMTVASQVPTRFHTTLRGPGGRMAQLYHKQGADQPLITLNDQFSNSWKLRELELWGHGGNQEHCLFLQPTKIDPNLGFALLDRWRLDDLYIHGFGGKAIFLDGGNQVNTPAQFGNVHNVHIDAPAVNNGSRCFSAMGQVAQITFSGDNRFDGAGRDTSLGNCIGGKYQNSDDGRFGDAFDANCHVNNGQPVAPWRQVYAGCSGYFRGVFGGIQGHLHAFYIEGSEFKIEAYYEDVRRPILLSNAHFIGGAMNRLQNGNEAPDYLIKSLGGCIVDPGSWEVGGGQAPKDFIRALNDHWLRPGVVSSGDAPDPASRTNGMTDTPQVVFGTVPIIQQETNIITGPQTVNAFLGHHVPVEGLATFEASGGPVTFVSNTLLFIPGGSAIIQPGELATFRRHENGWHLVGVCTAATMAAAVVNPRNRCTAHTNTAQAVGAGFNLIPMTTADDDPQGMLANGVITIAAPGLYLVVLKLRYADGSPPGVNYSLTWLASDGPENEWKTTAGNRQGANNPFRRALAKGQQVGLYSYVDGGPLTVSSASISIQQVG